MILFPCFRSCYFFNGYNYAFYKVQRYVTYNSHNNPNEKIILLISSRTFLKILLDFDQFL